MPTDPRWETIGPPPLGLFAVEQVRALRDLAAGRERRKIARRAAPGDGHAVLVLPGLLAGDFSTAPLRAFLRDLCYDARGWKLGINRGPAPEKLRALDDRLERLFDRHGRRVSLIGWSLGGIFARELARAHPERVRLVVSMGSPFRDISATHATRLVPLRRGSTPLEENRDLQTWLRQPLDVPTTSIYSRTDGIVHWQSCLEEEGPQRENVEVECSHTGMGFHPAVLEVIADRLGQPEGEWHPYGAPPGHPETDSLRRAS
ncbi:MAG: alpha/beta hydrolase [Deltaproteobacteria bacterium]|nr:alpha/beta hydrolase [Deltaproteobacteria bacterium]MBW2393979.1 alpha/beta hydrolase [Deltaproteobacteria bacterium]